MEQQGAAADVAVEPPGAGKNAARAPDSRKPSRNLSRWGALIFSGTRQM